LAAMCFAKGSTRFNNWFLNTRLYKAHLESFVKERAMTLKTKISLCAFASLMLLFAFVVMNNIYGRIVIVCVIAFKYYYFIFLIKTIKPESTDQENTAD
ncbi:MAG: YbaN family protein, partial [Oscillospiraceae bacterium]